MRSFLVPYLFRGGGEGQPIGELVAVSPDDRWLVVFREGQLVLVDDVGGGETTLLASGVPVTRGGYHRVAAFGSDSRHLVYFRMEKDASVLFTRDLARHREREVRIPNERVSQIVAEPAGHWVRVLLRRGHEPDYPGLYDAPSLSGPPREGRVCADPRPQYWMFGLRGAQLWLDLATGEVRSDPQVLAQLGDIAITRMADSSIRVRGEMIVPASCKAKIVAVAVDPLRIVAACATTTEDVSMELFGLGLHVKIGIVPPPRNSVVRFVDRSYVCPRPNVCIAIQDGSRVDLRGAVVAVVGDNVVGWDGDGYLFASGPARGGRLPSVREYPRQEADSIHALGMTIIDLRSSRVLGVVEQAPVAVDTAGRALVPAMEGPDMQPWNIGPLRWVTPRPSPVSPP